MARMSMPVFRPPPPPRPPSPPRPAPPRMPPPPPPRVAMPSPPRVPSYSAPRATAPVGPKPVNTFQKLSTAQKIAVTNQYRPQISPSQAQQVPRAIQGTPAAAVFAYNKPPSTPTSRDGGAGWMRGGQNWAGGRAPAVGGGGIGGIIYKDNIIKRYGNKYENFLFNAQNYKRGKGATNLAQRGGEEYNPFGDGGESFSALEAQQKFTRRRGPFSSMADTFSINPAFDGSTIDTEARDFMKERALQQSINS